MSGLSTGASSAPLAIVSYCLSSITMTVTNKLILSNYEFRMNFLLLAIQSIVCIIILEMFILGKFIPAHRPFRWHEAKSWFTVSLSLVAMIYTGSKALQYLTIPCFTIFKNLTIILIAYAERFINGPSAAPVSQLMLVSFALMVLSSLVAGWSDIVQGKLVKSRDVSVVSAYGWMFINCLTTAGYALMMRVRIKAVGFKDFDTVFYNNLLCIPLLLGFSLLTEIPEAFVVHSRFLSDKATESSSFSGLMAGIMISSIATFAISFSTAWCVRVTSSTTYSMTGALNKLPIAISGILFFGDPATFGSVTSIAIAFLGGIVYSHAKNLQAATEKRSPLLPVSTPLTPDDKLLPSDLNKN